MSAAFTGKQMDEAQTILKKSLGSSWRRFAAQKMGDLVRLPFVSKIGDMADLAARTLATQLAHGRASLTSWVANLLRKLFPHYLAGSLVALGKTELESDDMETLERATGQQGAFLNGFAAEIKTGQVVTSQEGQPARGFLARTGSYGQAVWLVAQNVRRAYYRRIGYTLERRILVAGRNCLVCVAQAALGLIKIGTLLAIGQTPCRQNCRCHFMFSK